MNGAASERLLSYRHTQSTICAVTIGAGAGSKYWGEENHRRAISGFAYGVDKPKNPDPESRDAKIDFAPGAKMKALHESDEGGEAHREGQQQEMDGDDPGELDPG
jgi:hypothetical protein